MKFKNIIPVFIAVSGLILAGCSDDETPTLLDEVQVSSSYVSIPMEGGTTQIMVTAKGEWSIDTAGVSQWLTVSPVKGGAGETEVSFTSAATLDGRTAELLLSCLGKQQRLNVIQGLATVSSASCKEVIDGPDSKTYQVTGVCTAIANTTYGNWYLEDSTGKIYIYGTLDAKGKPKNFASLVLRSEMR